MISVENLRFTYRGNDTETIKGVSFVVKQGEIFGLLGPSGVGKSTIQKIIIGILKNYQGQVRILDKESKDIKPGFYNRIGIAFEFPNFYYKLTALENLLFFRSMYPNCRTNPHDLLALVDLEKDAKKKVGGFSKGMKMRLNFCRALLNNPEIMFLDEPTSGLDPVNSRILKDLILKKKQEGKTIILNTHDMSVADEICDRVAFIVDGKLALIDSPRTVKIQHGNKKVRVEYKENNTLAFQDFELNNLAENKSFLELLKSKNIETIHTQEATLERVFIETTGKRLT